jgi:hypothetical protein
METGARRLTWLRNTVLAVFVAAILAGLFLPIYTDEVGWRIQERAGFEGVDKLFSELCGPNTVIRPPFWMMPARWYSALFNALFADPLYVRLSGILYALVWTGMLLLVVRRAAHGAREQIALSTLAIAFMSLGTMPLMLILSRPEQPILLAFTGAILIVLAGWKQTAATPAGIAWLRSAGILLLALVAMSYHVKAVATTPLFLVCLALASRGSKALAPRVVLGIVLVAAGVWAGHYWVERFACPTNAIVRTEYLRNTGAAMVSTTSGSQVLPLLGRLLGNVSLYLYPGLPAPRVDPMSGWLPPNRISAANSFTWFLALVFVWTIALLACLYCLVRAARRALRERKLDARAGLALALLATVIGWSMTGFVSIYEASFALPMLVFAVVLSLSTYEGEAGFAKAIDAGAVALGLAGIVSVALVTAMYGPSLVHASAERGYLAEQPLSISPFGFAAEKREILAVARSCGISDRVTPHALLLDDLTYFPFMRSNMPDHRHGLFPKIPLTNDPMGYLRRNGSDGIVSACEPLPPELRARARRQGQFCCLAPKDF